MPSYIDWWKIWELNAGFNLGLLYAITFYWAIRNVDKKNQSNETEVRSKYIEWRDTLFLAFGGFILLFFVGFEYFFWTGLALSLFYFVVMSLTTTGDLDSQLIAERRKNVSLIYSIFFLVFLMFHGGSERLGIILEIFTLDEVSLSTVVAETAFFSSFFSGTAHCANKGKAGRANKNLLRFISIFN